MKPFDLEKAKNGAAVCLRDGTPVKILDFEYQDKNGSKILYKYFDEKSEMDRFMFANMNGESAMIFPETDSTEKKERFDLFMAPVYAYMNVFKSEDGTRLHGGTLYPTPEDCVKRAKRTWNARPFCIARVELLEDPNMYDKVNQ